MMDFTEFVLDNQCDTGIEMLGPQLLNQFEHLYKYPKASEARGLADTRFYPHTGKSENQKRTLAHTIDFAQLMAIVYSAIFQNRKITPQWTWIQGSMAMSGPTVAYLGKILSALESWLRRIQKN
jgi:hypothetical protein